MEIYCTARFVAKNGHKKALINELKLLIPETLKESGCIRYELTEEIDYKGSNSESWDLCLFEQWKSRKDFDAHCEKVYIKDFFNTTARMYVDKMDVRLYHHV